MKRYTDWNSQHRVILHADLIHLKRADGNGIDALLHVEPNRAKCMHFCRVVFLPPRGFDLVIVRHTQYLSWMCALIVRCRYAVTPPKARSVPC